MSGKQCLLKHVDELGLKGFWQFHQYDKSSEHHPE